MDDKVLRRGVGPDRRIRRRKAAFDASGLRSSRASCIEHRQKEVGIDLTPAMSAAAV